MTESSVLQLFSTVGAAAALLYIVKQFIDGKLHSSSEVDGLRDDKRRLMEMNANQSAALDAANQQMERLIDALNKAEPGR
jgi:hypothetical protein